MGERVVTVGPVQDVGTEDIFADRFGEFALISLETPLRRAYILCIPPPGKSREP